MIGIDVSVWQGTMRWDEAASEGAEFAYIKASQGTAVDPKWGVNSCSCHLKYKGAYHYLDYTTQHYTVGKEDEFGKAQADFFLKTVGNFGNLVGMLDIETNKFWEPLHLNYARAAKIARAFKRQFEARTGHKLGIYMNLSTTWAEEWRPYLTDGPLWVAQYNETLGVPGGWSKWHIWQNSELGDGANYGAESEHIDLNISNDATFHEVVTDGSTPPPGVPPEVHTKTIELKTVKVATLNMRSGPGVNFAIVGSLPGGKEVEILETVNVGLDMWARVGQGQWSAVKYNGAVYLE